MVTERMIEAAADALYKDACAGTVAPPPDLKELGSEELANDFRRQARAALLAAEAAAWGPMETAPRDWGPFLVETEPEFAFQKPRLDIAHRNTYADGTSVIYGLACDISTFRRWRPLPTPPGATDE